MVELKQNNPKQIQGQGIEGELSGLSASTDRARFVALPGFLREEAEPEALGAEHLADRRQNQAPTAIRILKGGSAETLDHSATFRFNPAGERVLDTRGDGQEGQFNFQGSPGHPLERVSVRDAGEDRETSTVLRGRSLAAVLVA